MSASLRPRAICHPDPEARGATDFRTQARDSRPLRRFLLSVLAATAFACSPETASQRAQEPAVSALDSLPADSPQRWVRIYDPQQAASGYTLTLHHARRPTIIDMNGRSVHAWPGARVKSRIRLLPDGSLLGLALSRKVVEYDWQGNLVWSYGTGTDLPHHDVIRLANGNTLFPVLPKGGETDDLLEVDHDGRVVWRWSAADHLESFIVERKRNRGDQTHINSVEELADNPHFRAGDERFRPGNILVSARNLNLVFVIDKATGKLVWHYDDRLDRQHEAKMIPLGFPGAGHVMLLDNGYRNRYRYRKSRIVEVDPLESTVVWDYLADDFYSPTSSVQQPLENGNVLIASSRGGRIFEVTREREIVWQWSPPFDPVRPSRYPYDYTPQLAALPRPEEIAVEAAPGYRHVDRWVYRFARKSGVRKETLAGTPQNVLADNNYCEEVLLPQAAELVVSYGVDKRRIQAAGLGSYRVRFGMTVTPIEGSESFELFVDEVDLEDTRRWREKRLSLADYGLTWVRLCVATEALASGAGQPTEPFAFWSNPKITVGGFKFPTRAETKPAADDLTADEIEAQREHLKALGYIN